MTLAQVCGDPTTPTTFLPSVLLRAARLARGDYLNYRRCVTWCWRNANSTVAGTPGGATCVPFDVTPWSFSFGSTLLTHGLTVLPAPHTRTPHPRVTAPPTHTFPHALPPYTPVPFACLVPVVGLRQAWWTIPHQLVGSLPSLPTFTAPA